MGKTFGNKGDIQKYDEKYMGPDGYYDDGRHICERLVRHPNKKKKHCITREFKEANGVMSCWRNRFGERHDKSDRMHALRNGQNATRRAVMKRKTQLLIEEAENEY